MAERTGLLGGLRRGEEPDERRYGGTVSDGRRGLPFARAGDPSAHRGHQGGGDWGSPTFAEAEGVVVDVELLGDGFQISGQICIGRFDRLSGWLNTQSGFIQVRHVDPVPPNDIDSGQLDRTLWVRVNQTVVIADRSAVNQVRPGAPIVEKQRRRVSVVTRGYELEGCIHVHADGDMTHFLEAADPRFLPMTDLTVRWQSNPPRVARFPFAMVNREQLVTLLEESDAPSSSLAPRQTRSA